MYKKILKLFSKIDYILVFKFLEKIANKNKNVSKLWTNSNWKDIRIPKDFNEFNVKQFNNEK